MLDKLHDKLSEYSYYFDEVEELISSGMDKLMSIGKILK